MAYMAIGLRVYYRPVFIPNMYKWSMHCSMHRSCPTLSSTYMLDSSSVCFLSLVNN